MIRHKRIISFTRARFSAQNRMGTIFYASLCFSIVIMYIIWPWCRASWIWNSSTIECSDVLPSIDSSLIQAPRIIHQTWKDNEPIPSEWQKASNSCKNLHPNYEYRLWTDNDGRELIKKELPDLLVTFDSYPYAIQRSDVIRLVTLYIYGGIYLDLDIVCLQSLETLLKYPIILPKTRPVGLSNDFMIAQPRHPFLYHVIKNLPSHQRRILTKYSTVMFSTGPMFLTEQATEYSDRSHIDIVSPELYGKYVFNESCSLFRHLKGSSWHGNDAMFIRWIYHRRSFIYSSILILFIIVAVLLSLFDYHRINNVLRREIFKEKKNVKIPDFPGQ